MYKEKDGHYYWLDLLRFLAAFAVLACHFRGALFVEYANLTHEYQSPVVFLFYFLTRFGFEAVLVFFVLSGFLVGGKVIQRLVDGSFKARDYAIDRFVRIMLPLFSSLLLYLPICLYCNIPIEVKSWIGSILSLQGILTAGAFETLWSLSYEVWFYILFFAMAIVLSKRDSVKQLMGGILLVLGFLVFLKLKASFLFVWLIAALVFSKFNPKSIKHPKVLALVFMTISIFLIIFLQVLSGSRFLSLYGLEHDETTREVIVVIFGLLFSIFVRIIIEYKPKSKIFEVVNNIGTKLAAFSYTLYLTHIPVLRMLEYLGVPKSSEVNIISILVYVGAMALAMIVAYIMYYLFERNTALVKTVLKNYFIR